MIECNVFFSRVVHGNVLRCDVLGHCEKKRITLLMGHSNQAIKPRGFLWKQSDFLRHKRYCYFLVFKPLAEKEEKYECRISFFFFVKASISFASLNGKCPRVKTFPVSFLRLQEHKVFFLIIRITIYPYLNHPEKNQMKNAARSSGSELPLRHARPFERS